ncbi:LysR family transcriptional regulator [Vibrio pectenicida]|uniref:LysR family transcriptional regulator n=1 Tax=Vibrio pectenicida TaxID=62763 RepID=A0A3R9KYU3_9VIBR|nr:LysR family transcriptional regulator [Vibrio pectenicida]RSD29164.1 LysR family transcriptional regulator [Vibrio pectenicida]
MHLPLNINQLEAFVLTAQHGSFSKAAKVLNKGRTTLSEHVNNLEIELNIELFDRNTRNPLLLTDGGKRLLHHASLMLKMAEQLNVVSQSISNQEEAELTLSVASVIPNCLVLEIIKNISKKFPNTSLCVLSQDKGLVHDSLLNKTTDVAITVTKRNQKIIPPPNIRGAFLCDLPMKFYTSPDSALQLKSYISHSDLIMEPCYLLRCLGDVGFRENSPSTVLSTFGSIDLIVKMLGTKGWTILPEYCLSHNLYPNKLKDLNTDFKVMSPSVSIGMAYSPLPMGPVKLALTEEIISCFRRFFSAWPSKSFDVVSS